MPQNDDYRKYLELQFKDLHANIEAININISGQLNAINSRIENTNSELTDINIHLTKLNSKVAEHEKFKGYAEQIIEDRPTKCPNLDKIKAVEGSLEKLGTKFDTTATEFNNLNIRLDERNILKNRRWVRVLGIGSLIIAFLSLGGYMYFGFKNINKTISGKQAIKTEQPITKK
jgi:chromosome segregation ATPase